MGHCDQHMSRPRRGQIVLFSAAIFLVVSACGGGDADPGKVLQDYQDARNSGDVDALMSLYAEDAVVTGHPLDNDGTAQGVEEIRRLEAGVPSNQRSEDATEFVDIQVSGSSVTFGHMFFNNISGCVAGGGHKVTVEDGKITHYAWGTSGAPCE